MLKTDKLTRHDPQFRILLVICVLLRSLPQINCVPLPSLHEFRGTHPLSYRLPEKFSLSFDAVSYVVTLPQLHRAPFDVRVDCGRSRIVCYSRDS